MTHIHLNQWKGQFQNNHSVARIRRKISGALAAGECVLVYDGYLDGLTDEIRAEIRRGWPSTKVVFALPHPFLSNESLSGKGQVKRKRNI